MSSFTAKTPAFEGPLEVLLNLIEARKLHVGDIALAAVERAPLFMPDARVTLAGLVSALQNILMNLPRLAVLPKVIVEKVMSLDEMITRLTGRIQGALRLGFRDFANAGAKAKKEIIVSFLAMLELVRRGAIRVTQEKHFDD